MFEQMFEIEYIESLNVAPTRVKASTVSFSYDFKTKAPRLIFLDWTYNPVFTHEGIPGIIKAIHFVKEANNGIEEKFPFEIGEMYVGGYNNKPDIDIDDQSVMHSVCTRYIKFTFTCFAQDGIHQGLIGVLDDGIHYSMISYH